PDVHVLLNLDALFPTILGCQQNEGLLGAIAVEGLLAVGRLQALPFGQDPDLEKMDGLRPGVVVLAVRHARARPHELNLPRPDDTAPARAVLVLESAFEDVGQNLHVAVAVPAEALAGLDTVVVQHPKGSKAHVRGVLVVTEGKRMPAVEPAQLGLPSLVGSPNLDHGAPYAQECRPDSI